MRVKRYLMNFTCKLPYGVMIAILIALLLLTKFYWRKNTANRSLLPARKEIHLINVSERHIDTETFHGDDIHCIRTVENYQNQDGDFIIPNNDKLANLPLDITDCLYQRYISHLQTMCAKRSRHGTVKDGWTICEDECYQPTANSYLYAISIHNVTVNVLSVKSTSSINVRRYQPMVGKRREKFKNFLDKDARIATLTLNNVVDVLLNNCRQNQVYEHCSRGKPTNEQHEQIFPNHLVLPDDNALSRLGKEDINILYNRYLSSVQIHCKDLVRLGNLKDGGWDVCHDKRYRPTRPCVIYSFGSNWDFSFDDDMASTYGCTVHVFDPSMRKNSGRRNQHVWFHNIGISNKTGVQHGGWKMSTISDIYKKLNHTKKDISIIKMDIEQTEWKSLPFMIRERSLQCVRQLFIEFHGVGLFEHLQIIRNLYSIGFRIFHYHKNPLGGLYNGKYVQYALCNEVYFLNINDPC